MRAEVSKSSNSLPSPEGVVKVGSGEEVILELSVHV